MTRPYRVRSRGAMRHTFIGRYRTKRLGKLQTVYYFGKWRWQRR